VFSYALEQPIEKFERCCKTEDRMTDERESPGSNTVRTEHDELYRKTQMLSNLANAQNAVENPKMAQNDLAAGTQTELPSFRDALWEAINGIAEKAPGAPIERELMIFDPVAEDWETEDRNAIPTLMETIRHGSLQPFFGV
jgi:hypothetical protein